MANAVSKSKLHHPTLRVIQIFEAVYQSNKGLTLAELSRTTGILKGTLHPIALTLVREGYLQYLGTRYEIGKNCFKLGYSYVNSLNYLSIFKPHMREIVASCDEICQLGILDGGDVLYVEKTEPEQAIRIEPSAGKTLVAYATALGKCLLSGLDNDKIKSLYPRKLLHYTTRTTPDLQTLFKQLEDIRHDGYAHEVGENNKDIECVAVPISVDNKIVASLSVSLPCFRSSTRKVKQVSNLLRKHAQLIESEIALLPKKFSLFSE